MENLYKYFNKKNNNKLILILLLAIFFFFSYTLENEKVEGLKNDLLKDLTIYDIAIFYNEYEQHELVGTILCWAKNNFIVEYKTHPQENVILFVYSKEQKSYISRKNVFLDDNILSDCYLILRFAYSYFINTINSINDDDINKIKITVEKDDGLHLNYTNRRERGKIKFTIDLEEWQIIFEDVGLNFVIDYLKAISKKQSNNSKNYTFIEFKGGGYNSFTSFTTKLIESYFLRSKTLQKFYDND
jgi:hypothetical protein